MDQVQTSASHAAVLDGSTRAASWLPTTSPAATSPGLLGADRVLHWMLRLACACEFVGHGAFGIITKVVWVPYFGVVGMSSPLAYALMPVIGTVDIILGLLVLLRAVLLYMAVWGFLTATIRPLSGEPIWEFVERIPNWAVPLAFLYLRGVGRSPRAWLR